ncbi:hypothetical protein [Paenibacillus residui]|uniref:Uncharacterized protein n=1 Tax=Paenibacillus residui TaxID=629724 RepID=A0ABW3D8E3_9BACL
MSYTEFNPNVKKVNLKPKGEVEIVLTTSLSDLRGSVETLSDMIDQKVRVALESAVVTYNVQINARTQKPIREYKVDESGVVSEIKPEGEQVEMDLNLPKEKVPIEEIPEEIERKIVDDFILSLLSPSYDDLPYPFFDWVSRLADGETYSRLASDYGLSSGRIVELIDEYRSRIAPLAAKWNEWREQKQDAETNMGQAAKPEVKSKSASIQDDGQNDIEVSEEEVGPESDNLDDDLPDWMKDGENDGVIEFEDTDKAEPAVSEAPVEVDKDELEQFILNKKPAFDDIQFDFPSLLQRKKAGETWMEIAHSVGATSGQLSSKWNLYKKRVRDIMKGPGAA